MVASRLKFETAINGSLLSPDLSLAEQFSVSFNPTHDFVSAVDSDAGAVFHLDCTHKHAMHCHMLEHVIADIFDRCGDGHSGARFRSAKSKTKVTRSVLHFLGVEQLVGAYVLMPMRGLV